MSEPRAPRSTEWQRMRAEGRTRFVLRHGILVRGVPMALVTILLLQAYQGELGLEMLASPGFHARLLGALVLFSVGGVLSAWARWKSFEARFDERR